MTKTKAEATTTETTMQPFIRVHRSAIVRIDSILSLDARGRGDYDVVLHDGDRVRLGRTYRGGVLRSLALRTTSGRV